MDVRLPKLGESAEGGAVVSILVKEGETITKGQTILELENEKAVAPIPSTAAGVVGQIRVKEGDRVTVGQVLLTLAGAAGPAAASPPAAKSVRAATRTAAAVAPVALPSAPASTESGAGERDAEPITLEGEIPGASPEVRRIARLLGLDLRGVRSAEPGGRIAMAELRAHVQRLQSLALAPRVAASGEPGAKAPAVAQVDFSRWGGVSRKPMSSLRRTISRRMVENWNAIPHVTQFDEADITALMELRKKYAPDYEKKGVRLTLTSFAVKAAVAALRKHPVFNSSLDEVAQEVVFKEYYHLGLAVDTEQGLIVPVIRNADRKSLFELSKEIGELADKARDRKVSLEDLQGGTFTLSNQGGIGGGHFTPIVNKPEVAILGLGKGALKAVVRDRKIEQRLMLPVAVSYDHRIIDGGTAARFTLDLVEALQTFSEADIKL